VLFSYRYGNPYGILRSLAVVDRLLGLLVRYPGAARMIGRALFALAGFAALLGLRLDRAFGRIERVGAAHPSIDQILPSWLVWAVPETGAGWIGVAAVAALGAWLAYTAREVERVSR
jgi:hypothetical protein